MGLHRLVAVLLGCCCASIAPRVNPVDAGTTRARASLAQLPACRAGVEVGQLTLVIAQCSSTACREGCCRQCAWAATLEGMSGRAPAPVAQVSRVLGLGERVLDCELEAWNSALAGQSVSLEAACVVR